MADRFDLEHNILSCWGILDEMKMLDEQGASVADMRCLITLYEYKFQKLWTVFEDMVHEGRFKKKEG
jgi:hypothetical protein